MWHFFVGWVVPDVSKGCGALVFRVKQFTVLSCLTLKKRRDTTSHVGRRESWKLRHDLYILRHVIEGEVNRRPCSGHGETRCAGEFLLENLIWLEHLGNVDVDGRIILKWPYINILTADIPMCCLIYTHKISVKTHHILYRYRIAAILCSV
jgi:hypothetical protein